MERFEQFLNAVHHCDKIKVILTGCGEEIFDTKEIGEAIEQIKAENAELKARLEKAVELPLDFNIFVKTEMGTGTVQGFMVFEDAIEIFVSGYKEPWGGEFEREEIELITEAEAQAKLDEMKGGATVE